MKTSEEERERKMSSYRDSMDSAKKHWQYAASMLSHLDKSSSTYASEASKWGSEVSRYESEYNSWKSKLQALG
jgi:hypothetical protein